MLTGLEKLKLISAWDTEPTVSEADLEAILESFARSDSSGIPPDGEEWVPTYDINGAAADVWLVKAARAAALTEIDPPGSGIVTSKVFDNCMLMARNYRSRRTGTARLK